MTKTLFIRLSTSVPSNSKKNEKFEKDFDKFNKVMKLGLVNHVESNQTLLSKFLFGIFAVVKTLEGTLLSTIRVHWSKSNSNSIV